MSRFARKGKPPKGFEYIADTLSALESELRDMVNEPHEGKRKVEAIWPIHQINWQRSRYVYDMYYKHKKITKEVYDYCIRNKLIDAGLIAKWKKPGYERLCSTYVINTKNYKFGTVSICRVPKQALGPDTIVEDPHTGCLGCASGPGGQRNIFGNKYGQYLASIQIAREEEMGRRKALKDATKKSESSVSAAKKAAEDEDTDEEGGGGGSDDEGPTPDTVWAVNETERNLESVGGSQNSSKEAAKAAQKQAPPPLGSVGGGGGGGGGPPGRYGGPPPPGMMGGPPPPGMMGGYGAPPMMGGPPPHMMGGPPPMMGGPPPPMGGAAPPPKRPRY